MKIIDIHDSPEELKKSLNEMAELSTHCYFEYDVDISCLKIHDESESFRIDAHNIHFKPMTYEEWNIHINNKDIEFIAILSGQLNYNAKLEKKSYNCIKGRIERKSKGLTYGLVRDGCLPSIFAIKRDSIVFLDVCAVNRIKKNDKGDKNKLKYGDGDFICHLKSQRFNLWMYILEGEHRRLQTKKEMIQRRNEAIGIIKNKLPFSTVVNSKICILNKAQFIYYTENKINFLIESEEYLREIVSFKKVNKEQTIFEKVKAIFFKAKSHNIDLDELIVYLVVSIAINCNKQDFEARLALKFPKKEGEIYSKELAHNGLSDVASIEVFANEVISNENGNFVYLTSDHDLIKLWLMLCPDTPKNEGDFARIKLDKLFEGMDISLINKIKSKIKNNEIF
jgi:hypothetical protein